MSNLGDTDIDVDLVKRNLLKAQLQGVDLRAYRDALSAAYLMRTETEDVLAPRAPECLTLWQAILIVLRHLFVDPERG